MFVLMLKSENQWIFGNFAWRKEDNRIYFGGLSEAKKFQTEQEAKDWAGLAIDQFDIKVLSEFESCS